MNLRPPTERYVHHYDLSRHNHHQFNLFQSRLDDSHELHSISTRPEKPWTLTHGFYATMGGFGIDGSTAGTPFLPKGAEHVMFSKPGIERLIELEYIEELTNVSVEDIRDKGKSSRIAKILIAIQTLWFSTQLIARLVQYLPISLLELSTFAHGVCTIFAIYFWWEKPQDIEQPTLLSLDRIQPLCAFLCMHSKVSRGQYDFNPADTKRFYNKKQEAERRSEINFWVAKAKTHRNNDSRKRKTRDPMTSSPALNSPIEPNVSNATHNSSTITRLRSPGKNSEQGDPSQFIHEPYLSANRPDPEDTSDLPHEAHNASPASDNLRVAKGCVVPNTIFALSSSQNYFESVLVGPTQRARLSLSSKVSELHPDFFRSFTNDYRINYLVTRVPEFDSNADSAVVVVILITAMVYGGLHCLAWSSESFASATERLLWRISCLTLMLALTLSLLGILTQMLCITAWSAVEDGFPRAVEQARKVLKSNRLMGAIFKFVRDVIFWSPMFVIILAFVLSRAYLLIECFINVRYLDSRVFLVPSWTTYFPHIG